MTRSFCMQSVSTEHWFPLVASFLHNSLYIEQLDRVFARVLDGRQMRPLAVALASASPPAAACCCACAGRQVCASTMWAIGSSQWGVRMEWGGERRGTAATSDAPTPLARPPPSATQAAAPVPTA